MEERYVVELLETAEKVGISVWVGGGWGVDALIGVQTRPHSDMDIYLEKRDAGRFVEILKAKGYAEVETEYTTESHTVWKTSAGRIVDLHLIEWKEEDAESLYFEGEAYPRHVLGGKGIISGLAVQCFTPEAQLLFHQGYEHSEKDIHDVRILCKTFGLDVPEEYIVG